MNTFTTNRSDLMRKISSGISSLDKLLDGGFVSPSIVYIVGRPGTGKTTISMQFIMEGAKKGEKGIYFSTLGEPPMMALSYMAPYKFFDERYFDNSTIEFLDLSSRFRGETHFKTTVDMVKEFVAKVNPSRIVIDSITPFSMRAHDVSTYRTMLFDLFLEMKAWGCTTIVIGECHQNYSGPEEYLADCVIELGYRKKNYELKKYLQIIKMRGAAHDTREHPLLISSEGVEIGNYPEGMHIEGIEKDDVGD